MATFFYLYGRNLRRVSTLLWLFMCILPINAIAGKTDSDTIISDTVLFNEKIFFRHASSVVLPDFSGNSSRLDSIRSFLTDTCARDILNIKIIGSYSQEGKKAFNTKLAKARAEALAAYLADIKLPLDPSTSIVPPDLSCKKPRLQRYAELQVLWKKYPYIDKAEDIAIVRGKEEELPSEVEISQNKRPGATSQKDSVSVASPTEQEFGEEATVPVRRHSFADNLYVSTNMLYDAALTPNIGLGLRINDRLSVTADWMYARWNNRNRRRYWRIYGGDIEVRYRIGKTRQDSPLGGHHIGVYGSMACYDFQAGRSHRGVLSDKYNYAAGLSYTYTLPVSTHFNIDFSVGFGYLWGTYKRHTPIDDCDVWLSTHKLGWFGPTKAGVSLVWLLGKSVKNNRKGGER